MISPFLRRAHLSRFLQQRRCSSLLTGEVIVCHSSSINPFANLAFEDWIYLNHDLSNKRILFLWRNLPTVVIGRHQNPWMECNIRKLHEHGVHLARRKSGGGTVYHDLGNVNITFFTARQTYNRRENIALIVQALRLRWQVNIEVTCRDGSSSKLGHLPAYHHCTLLCNVDTHTLNDLLSPTYSSVTSKATPSLKSDVKNLSAVDPSISFSSVTRALSEEFREVYSPHREVKVLSIDPTSEQEFPGITAITEEHQSWDWVYGKTPRFSAHFSPRFHFGPLKLHLSSYHGIIESAELEQGTVVSPPVAELIQQLTGRRFRAADVEEAFSSFVASSDLTSEEESQCREVIHWLTKLL